MRYAGDKPTNAMRSPHIWSLWIGIAAATLLLAAARLHATQQEQAMSSANPQDAGSSPEQCPLPVSEEEFKRRLTTEQYHVMREGGTEQPFANAYWNNKKPGLYVDPVTGEALFASSDKFDSRTGWPSFTRPVKRESVVEHTDASLGMPRTEVRAKQSGSHLGHVFDDGPGPTGLRYCINSAALRFVPLEDLEQEGYGPYRGLLTPEAPASGEQR
jgi:methionine-R-sulfoxide reductase